MTRLPGFGPRELRVLRALIDGPQSRADVDRIAHAANGPGVIRNLRLMGIDIETERVRDRGFDGETIFYGLYSLTPEGREAASMVLGIRSSSSDRGTAELGEGYGQE